MDRLRSYEGLTLETIRELHELRQATVAMADLWCKLATANIAVPRRYRGRRELTGARNAWTEAAACYRRAGLGRMARKCRQAAATLAEFNP
jgi:hypothetical protein